MEAAYEGTWNTSMESETKAKRSIWLNFCQRPLYFSRAEKYLSYARWIMLLLTQEAMVFMIAGTPRRETTNLVTPKTEGRCSWEAPRLKSDCS
jgi:hypothetical protein